MQPTLTVLPPVLSAMSRVWMKEKAMQLHRMLKGPNSFATVLVSPMRPALACRRRKLLSQWLLLRAQRTTLHFKKAAMKRLI